MINSLVEIVVSTAANGVRARQYCVGRQIVVSTMRAATPRSVMFIRWLPQSLRDRLAESGVALRLREEYAGW